jgi:predicted  nucleic acid-binding Zn-ribbon protein
MIRSVEQEQKQKADNALLTSELSRLSNQLRRVREAYAAGVDTLDEYKENKAHIQSQIDSVRQKIQPDMPAIDHEHLIEKLKSAIWSGIEVAKSDAPDSLKNDVLRSFIHSISFDRKNGDVEISYTL